MRDALLEKCDGVAVMHIAVDDRSTEGLVYVKCRTDADALNAFKRIQGCWFDGKIPVTCLLLASMGKVRAYSVVSANGRKMIFAIYAP